MNSQLNFRTCLLLLVLTILAWAPLSAQSLTDFIGPLLPSPATAVFSSSSADLSLATILPQAAALKEEHRTLESEIASILHVEPFTKDSKILKDKMSELKSRLVEIRSSGTYGFEQVSELRSQARIVLESVNRQIRLVGERLQRSEALKILWTSKEIVWKTHQKTFALEAESAISTVIHEAEESIVAARKSLEGIELPLVKFQQVFIEQQRDCQSFIGDIDKLMVEMREDLFRRSRPAMFTLSFLSQFDKSVWEEFWMGVAGLELPASSFYATYGWIIVMQLIFSIIFVYFFRSLQKHNLEQLRLGFLAEKYISAGILLGILVPLPLFEDLPKLVKLIMAGLVAINASRVLAARIEAVWRRRLVYLLVGLYLTIQFLNLIALPAPVFRIFMAAMGLSSALLCFWRARINLLKSSSLRFVAGVRLGGAAMMLVFLAQVAGYVAFSNYLFDISIKTVFLGLIAWLINLILKGAIEAIFDNSWVRKSQIINKHYRVFIRRTSMVADLLVVFFAFAGTLSVWGFADNTTQAALKIWNAGFYLQGNSITFGLIVSAVALCYLAIFSSWVLQRVLDEEVYPRKKVERGVGISINRLIHYAFVVIGVSLAFSTLGIGMQNLTVIIGAFGIGIGFGLQNIVNNFASGLILLFERSVKVGDVVQINGEWGTIKNLGLRATVVETFDHSEMIVPNSDLVSTMVTNWTLSDRQVRLIVKIGVAYGSDVDLVTRLLYQVAQENPFVMKVPEPVVLFLNFGASSLDFELRVWVADIDNRLRIQNEINREIDRLFRENAVEIPFSQHDLHLRTIDQPFKETLRSLVDKDSPVKPL